MKPTGNQPAIPRRPVGVQRNAPATPASDDAAPVNLHLARPSVPGRGAPSASLAALSVSPPHASDVLGDVIKLMSGKKVDPHKCFLQLSAAGACVQPEARATQRFETPQHALLMRGVMLDELMCSRPAQEQRTYGTSIGPAVDKYLVAWMQQRQRDCSKGGRDPGAAISVPEFMQFFKPIRSLRGEPSREVIARLDALTAGMTEIKTPTRCEVVDRAFEHVVPNPTARKQAVFHQMMFGEGTLQAEAWVDQLAKDRDAVDRTLENCVPLIKGAMLECGYAIAEEEGFMLAIQPMPVSVARETIRQMRQGHIYLAASNACLIASIRREPELSQPAIALAYSLLEKFTLNDGVTDHLGGPWAAAAAIMLNLPEPTLRTLVFPRRVVDLLAAEARMLLGNAHIRGPMGNDKCLPDRPQQIPRLLRRYAVDALKTVEGSRMAARFCAALEILRHNADRLDLLLERAEETPAELEGRPLAAVLDACVPSRFAPAQGLGWMSDPEPTLTWDGEWSADEDGMAATSTVPTSTVPTSTAGTSTAATITVATTAPPVITVTEDARKPGRVARPAKQPGSQPDKPSAHWHPAEHEALEKEEVKLRKLKNKLVKLGMLNPYAVWNRATRDEYLARRTEERYLRNLGTTQVVGGRLVQPL